MIHEPRADEPERPATDLCHLLEPRDHGIRDRHQGGITVLGLVGSEDLPLEASASPLHHPGFMLAHGTGEESPLPEPMLERSGAL